VRLAKGQLGRLSVPRGRAIVTDRLSSAAEFAHRDATFSIKPEDESMSDEILRAYHQAIARHQERTGVSYPLHVHRRGYRASLLDQQRSAGGKFQVRCSGPDQDHAGIALMENSSL
jgi:hypothetical protein